jgi:hypothetical protein
MNSEPSAVRPRVLLNWDLPGCATSRGNEPLYIWITSGLTRFEVRQTAHHGKSSLYATSIKMVAAWKSDTLKPTKEPNNRQSLPHAICVPSKLSP